MCLERKIAIQSRQVQCSVSLIWHKMNIVFPIVMVTQDKNIIQR